MSNFNLVPSKWRNGPKFCVSKRTPKQKLETRDFSDLFIIIAENNLIFKLIKLFFRL